MRVRTRRLTVDSWAAFALARRSAFGVSLCSLARPSAALRALLRPPLYSAVMWMRLQQRSSMPARNAHPTLDALRMNAADRFSLSLCPLPFSLSSPTHPERRCRWCQSALHHGAPICSDAVGSCSCIGCSAHAGTRRRRRHRGRTLLLSSRCALLIRSPFVMCVQLPLATRRAGERSTPRGDWCACSRCRPPFAMPLGPRIRRNWTMTMRLALLCCPLAPLDSMICRRCR